MIASLDVTHERVWQANQSLRAERTVTVLGKQNGLVSRDIFKAEVDRNAYDTQSWLKVSVLRSTGWVVLGVIPISQSQIRHHSYTSRNDDEWTAAIHTDLDELVGIGIAILGVRA